MFSDISAMKGPGKAIVRHITPTCEVALVRFDDGSVGIRRDGLILTMWEPNEFKDCINAFIHQVNVDSDRPLLAVILSSMTHDERIDLLPKAWN